MLIEPVALADFFLSFFSAAMIILCAGVYAGLFAWAKISSRLRIHYAAYLVYGLLLVFIVIFSQVNHFSGYWLLISILMAVGYAFMPRAIWQLCVATHANHEH